MKEHLTFVIKVIFITTIEKHYLVYTYSSFVRGINFTLMLTHPNIALIMFIVSPGNCGVRSFIDKRMFVPLFLRED